MYTLGAMTCEIQLNKLDFLYRFTAYTTICKYKLQCINRLTECIFQYGNVIVQLIQATDAYPKLSTICANNQLSTVDLGYNVMKGIEYFVSL
jgi:hypothetical protein